ncbi:MAG TPA: hypothetical protein DCM87_05055 [Planctomycetes bacterium]|jgi:hypothetical protein|nr:hypothetical protein [Planctomycetota bacterium]
MTRIAPRDLFLARLPAPARRAFLQCTELPLFRRSHWYLAGGTALALQVGHRQSRDLDFFTPRPAFAELELERSLLATGGWKTDLRERGTIYGTLSGAKVSFIAYPFFAPSREKIACGNLTIIPPRDIAVMKIVAVSQRGRKRDFVDLFWFCNNREPLDTLIPRVLAQYPARRHNLPHFLKSLTYFADAEGEPMPRLFFKTSWKAIRGFFEREVPRIARTILQLE